MTVITQIGLEKSKYRVTGESTTYLRVVKGSRDYFSNFGTPFISRERLELETSNADSSPGVLTK